MRPEELTSFSQEIYQILTVIRYDKRDVPYRSVAAERLCSAREGSYVSEKRRRT